MKMKALNMIAATACCTLLALSCQSNPQQSTTSTTLKTPGNPYLPLWEHVPDGEPKVFEDPDRPGHYRAYIIGSHDVSANRYCGPDIRVWSAPVENLNEWRDDGPIFTYQAANGRWDVMYAPDLVEVIEKDAKGKDKKVYYLYPHSRGPRREAMVCKGDRPDGPFTPLNLDENEAAIAGSCIGFDRKAELILLVDEQCFVYAILQCVDMYGQLQCSLPVYHLPKNLGNVIVVDGIAFSLCDLFEYVFAARNHELALLLLIREEKQPVLLFAVDFCGSLEF